MSDEAVVAVSVPAPVPVPAPIKSAVVEHLFTLPILLGLVGIFAGHAASAAFFPVGSPWQSFLRGIADTFGVGSVFAGQLWKSLNDRMRLAAANAGAVAPTTTVNVPMGTVNVSNDSANPNPMRLDDEELAALARYRVQRDAAKAAEGATP